MKNKRDKYYMFAPAPLHPDPPDYRQKNQTASIWSQPCPGCGGVGGWVILGCMDTNIGMATKCHRCNGTGKIPRYLTLEEYKDLTGEEWIGAVLINVDDQGWDLWSMNDYVRVSHYGHFCLCSGNHPQPPKDYRHGGKDE